MYFFVDTIALDPKFFAIKRPEANALVKAVSMFTNSGKNKTKSKANINLYFSELGDDYDGREI